MSQRSRLTPAPRGDDSDARCPRAEERRRISIRLGAGLAGIGLLGLGTLLVRLAPDQWQIGELFRGLAAAVVAIPTLVSGLRGVVTGDTRRATDQLVAIAVLAAAATGDFVTATFIPLFLEVGRLFEERSSLGARAAIDGIRALGARQAVRWRNGVEERVDPEQPEAGRRNPRPARREDCRRRHGSRRAGRGGPVRHHRRVDSSRTSGLAAPFLPAPWRWTDCSSIQVRGAGADTVLGRVVQLLAEVERTSVPVLRLFERRAGVWLPLVLTAGGQHAVLHRKSFTRHRRARGGDANGSGSRGPSRRGGRHDRGHPTSHPHQERRFFRTGLRRRYLDPRQDRHRHRGRASRHRNPAGTGRDRGDAAGVWRLRAASARCIRFRAPL